MIILVHAHEEHRYACASCGRLANELFKKTGEVCTVESMRALRLQGVRPDYLNAHNVKRREMRARAARGSPADLPQPIPTQTNAAEHDMLDPMSQLAAPLYQARPLTPSAEVIRSSVSPTVWALSPGLTPSRWPLAPRSTPSQTLDIASLTSAPDATSDAGPEAQLFTSVPTNNQFTLDMAGVSVCDPAEPTPAAQGVHAVTLDVAFTSHTDFTFDATFGEYPPQFAGTQPVSASGAMPVLEQPIGAAIDSLALFLSGRFSPAYTLGIASACNPLSRAISTG